MRRMKALNEFSIHNQYIVFNISRSSRALDNGDRPQPEAADEHIWGDCESLVEDVVSTFPQPTVYPVGKAETRIISQPKFPRQIHQSTGKLSTTGPTYPQKTGGYPQRALRVGRLCPQDPQIWGG